MADDRRLLRLAPADNVCIARVSLAAGDAIVLDDRPVELVDAVPAAHKVAARDLRSGEVVLRFGTPIGSTTRAVRAGEWVHTHNLRSDYIETVAERGGA
jgi:SAF domain